MVTSWGRGLVGAEAITGPPFVMARGVLFREFIYSVPFGTMLISEHGGREDQ